MEILLHFFDPGAGVLYRKAVPGAGILTERNSDPGVSPGGGGMVTGQIDTCIATLVPLRSHNRITNCVNSVLTANLLQWGPFFMWTPMETNFLTVKLQ